MSSPYDQQEHIDQLHSRIVALEKLVREMATYELIANVKPTSRRAGVLASLIEDLPDESGEPQPEVRR